MKPTLPWTKLTGQISNNFQLIRRFLDKFTAKVLSYLCWHLQKSMAKHVKFAFWCDGPYTSHIPYFVEPFDNLQQILQGFACIMFSCERFTQPSEEVGHTAPYRANNKLPKLQIDITIKYNCIHINSGGYLHLCICLLKSDVFSGRIVLKNFI